MTIRVEEHIWIPMSDGVRLGARLWLPEGAEQSPVPAILEYIPYRKRDGTRGRDEPMHGYFASRGYAAIAWTCAAPANPMATWQTNI